MKFLFATALCLLACTASAQDDARFLNCIGDVETGHLAKPRFAIGRAGERGRYQMKATAWSDANCTLMTEGQPTQEFIGWRDATAQDLVARAYLRTLRSRLTALGYPSPTAVQLALVWNIGLTAALKRHLAPNDYALRVGNLFHLPSPLTR